MRTSFINGTRRKLLVAVMAALLPVASANAWWGGYGPGAYGCDPQWAYMKEYGFLDRWGPSRGDVDRLRRDEWRAANDSWYYGGYTGSDDPVTKAVRRRCPAGYHRYYRGYRGPYGW